MSRDLLQDEIDLLTKNLDKATSIFQGSDVPELVVIVTTATNLTRAVLVGLREVVLAIDRGNNVIR